MLRKTSTAVPTRGIVGTICVEPQDIGPDNPPLEALEDEDTPALPRPPVIEGEDDRFIQGGPDTPPRCPAVEAKEFINPLTGQTDYYYELVDPDAFVPPGCPVGSGFFT